MSIKFGQTAINKIYRGSTAINKIYRASSQIYSGGATLGALTMSGLLQNGLTSSGTINGATAGSTITSNVTGLTVNSAARTYTFDGTASAATVSNALVETLSATSVNNAQTVMPARTGTLKLSGRHFIVNKPAAAMVLAGYATNSVISATSDDGTTLTVGTNSQGFPLLVGTFTTTGVKTITITDSSTGTSTFPVMVTSAPVKPTLVSAKAAAATLVAARTARTDVTAAPVQPTVTFNTGASTVNGRSLASGGSTATTSLADGKAGIACQTTQTLGYIYANTSTGQTNMQFGTGMYKQWRMQKRYFDFKVGGSVSNGYNTLQVSLIWSEDGGATWIKTTEPVDWKPTTVGTCYVTFDFGSNADRIVRMYHGEGLSCAGFNFEAGETLTTYTDTGPKFGFWNDSYAWGQGALDQSLGSFPHVFADYFGQAGSISFGHRTNAYARLGGSAGTHAYVMDRVASNPWAIDEATRFNQLDAMIFHMTINDYTLSNFTTNNAPTNVFNNAGGSNSFVQGPTTYYNMLTLCYSRARWAHTNAWIVVETGLYNPDGAPNATISNTQIQAFSDMFDTDPMAIMVNVQTGVYRWMGVNYTIPAFTAPLVASGAIGSSQYYPPTNVVLDGTISGTTLTVTAITSGGPIMPGLGTGSSGTANRIYKQLTGTTGSTGTYQLEYAPGDVGVTTSMTYNGDTPHPLQSGHTVIGNMIGAGLLYGANLAIVA